MSTLRLDWTLDIFNNHVIVITLKDLVLNLACLLPPSCLFFPPSIILILHSLHNYSFFQLTLNTDRYTSSSVNSPHCQALTQTSFHSRHCQSSSHLQPHISISSNTIRYHEDYTHHLHRAPRRLLSQRSRTRKPSAWNTRRSRTPDMLPLRTTMPQIQTCLRRLCRSSSRPDHIRGTPIPLLLSFRWGLFACQA